MDLSYDLHMPIYINLSERDSREYTKDKRAEEKH